MLNPTVFQVLVGVGLLLAILSLIKSTPQLCSVGLILVCAALLAGKAN